MAKPVKTWRGRYKNEYSAMKSHIFFFTFLGVISAHGQFITQMNVVYSKTVGDSFEIYVSLPASYNAIETCKVVYYLDGNLKSGKKLRSLISTTPTKHLGKTIFVGIGHIGNYHVLRRRDFILPSIKGKDTAGRDNYYGQTERFYSYLKNELVPFIDSRFRTNVDSNCILGHSLGGLFVVFCLFKSDDLFSKYFALSPALWIDKYSIYRFNRIESGFNRKKFLYLSAGSRERMNKILKGSKELKRFLDKNSYSNLKFEYDVWKGRTHNTEVPLALEKILVEQL